MINVDLDIVDQSVRANPATMKVFKLTSLLLFTFHYCNAVTYEVSNYAVNWFEAQQVNIFLEIFLLL